MRQSCLECFALTAVLFVNDDFRAGFARTLRGMIGRAVINNDNMIEPFACSPSDIADVFFVLICWNNGSGLRANILRHVERSRAIPLRNLKVLPRGSSTSLRFARNDNDCKRSDKRLAVCLSTNDWMKICRVVRAAHQRSGGDVQKSFSSGDVAVVIELLGRDVLNHWQMFSAWPQILAHRQDFAADLAQVVHRLEKFRFLFA